MNLLSLFARQSSTFLDVLQRDESSCEGGCLTRWKIIFAAILFIQALVFAHLVYILKFFKSFNTSAVRNALHVLNAFSGGIFLATGMLHIFPESIAIYNGEHAHDEHDEENHSGETGHDGHDHRKEDGDEEEDHEEGHGFPWPFFAIIMAFYLFFFIERILLPKVLKDRAVCQLDVEAGEEGRHLHSESDNEDLEAKVMENPFRPGKAGILSKDFLWALIQIMGISAHSLFESMAIGLASQSSTSTNIFIATVLHRGFTALAIAIRIIDRLNYFAFLLLLVLFSLIVPLGVGIGFAVTTIGDKVQGVLFSVSAGTFLYVGAYEVMAEEFVLNKNSPLLKFAVTMFGVAVISVITGILVATDIHG